MREMKSWTKDDSMNEKTDVDQSDENQTSHFSAILYIKSEVRNLILIRLDVDKSERALQ